MKNTHKSKKKKIHLTEKWKFAGIGITQFFQVVIIAIYFAVFFLLSMCIYALASGTDGCNNATVIDNNEAVADNAPDVIQTSRVKPIVVNENGIPEVVKPYNKHSENSVTYSEDDLYYLAAAVCCESGGATEEVQLLVANVVINRVNSDIYPNTIYEVLTQYAQYGVMWRDGIFFPSWATDEIKDQCYSVARRILEGERVCPENVLFQAEFPQGSGIFKYFDEGYYFCYYGN